jgi:hypothetical protein
MAGQAPRHNVRLELEPDPDAIHGTVEHKDGTREPFWGWFELMAALERVTATGPDDGANEGDGRAGP